MLWKAATFLPLVNHGFELIGDTEPLLYDPTDLKRKTVLI